MRLPGYLDSKALLTIQRCNEWVVRREINKASNDLVNKHRSKMLYALFEFSEPNGVLTPTLVLLHALMYDDSQSISQGLAFTHLLDNNFGSQHAYNASASLNTYREVQNAD